MSDIRQVSLCNTVNKHRGLEKVDILYTISIRFCK